MNPLVRPSSRTCGSSRALRRGWHGLAGVLMVFGLALAAHADGFAELQEALRTFRTDGPKGWSFVQTTTGAGEIRVERFDAAQPEFARWTLLQQNGRAPSAEEVTGYREMQSRRSRGGTAPLLTDQLDLSTAQVAADDAERITYRCRLKPGERGDRTAEHLTATLVVHRSTHSIERFELAATESFSPTFGVRITEMRTVMTYSLPDPQRPSLLERITTRLRGRAFLLKSLDADLAVIRTEQAPARH